MSEMMAKYTNLLNEYNNLVNQPDWYVKRTDLVFKMDAAWGRLTETERNMMLQQANALYQTRQAK